MGCSEQAVQYVIVIQTLVEFWFHCNLRMPWWVGYIVQTPQQHRYHHEIGRHNGSYFDLPIFDLIHGTFIDPLASQEVVCGMGKREDQLWDLLMCRNVTGRYYPPTATRRKESSYLGFLVSHKTIKTSNKTPSPIET